MDRYKLELKCLERTINKCLNAPFQNTSRKTEPMDSRLIFSYIAKHLFKGISNSEIGRYIDRNSQSVLSQLKTAKNLIDADKNFRYKYNIVLREVPSVLEDVLKERRKHYLKEFNKACKELESFQFNKNKEL